LQRRVDGGVPREPCVPPSSPCAREAVRSPLCRAARPTSPTSPAPQAPSMWHIFPTANMPPEAPSTPKVSRAPSTASILCLSPGCLPGRRKKCQDVSAAAEKRARWNCRWHPNMAGPVDEVCPLVLASLARAGCAGAHSTGPMRHSSSTRWAESERVSTVNRVGVWKPPSGCRIDSTTAVGDAVGVWRSRSVIGLSD